MIKRWLVFIFLQILIVAAVAGIVFMHKDKVALVKLPPASLEQWYKPANKRQVWLHNMFKLRREMQAIEHYAEIGDQEKLEKWMNSFSQHYIKIGEMVPEWQMRLDLSTLNHLQSMVTDSQYTQVPGALETIQQNCNSCHVDYRSIVATRYRAPDFSQPALAKNDDFKKQMQQLNKDVNALKIASGDGRPQDALVSFAALKLGIAKLSDTCSTCHKKPEKNLLTEDINGTLDKLEAALVSGTVRDQGMTLGTLAVQACANCHANHRLNYEARELFKNERSLLDLIKH